MHTTISAFEDDLAAKRTLAQKIAVVRGISPQLYDSHAKVLLDPIERLFERAAKKNDDYSIAVCLRARAECSYWLGKTDDAIRDALRAVEICENINDASLLGSALIIAGRSYDNKGAFARAINCFDKCVIIGTKQHNKRLVMKAYNQKAGVYKILRLPDQALIYWRKSAALANELDDKRAIAASHWTAALIYEKTKEFQTAIAHIRMAINGFAEIQDERFEAAAAMHLAVLESEYEQLSGVAVNVERHISHCHRAFNIYCKTNSIDSQAIALLRYGLIYKRAGDFPNALHYYIKSERLLVKNQYSGLSLAEARYGIGLTYAALGEDTKAIDYLERAYNMGRVIDEHNAAYLICEHLAEAYERRGDMAMAMRYLRIYYDAKDELFSRDRQQEIIRLEMKIEIERMQQEREATLSHNETLKMELERKEKELTALALYMSQKNKMLDDLKNIIEDAKRVQNQNGTALLNSLLERVDESLHSEENWQTFERHFTNTHGDFLKNLSQRFTTLTAGELKVCALIKLNLTTKEIARLLCTSVRSAETYRFRIRKKMGLKRSANLASHLAGL